MYKPLIFSTLIFAGLLAVSLQAGERISRLMKDPLQGKWEVTLTPDEDARRAGERDIKDTLIFKPGTFASTTFQKRGFEPTPYDEDTRQGGVGGFNTQQTSKTDQGKTKWSGFVTVDQIQGDLVWTKKDGTVLNYTYRGSKQ